LAWSTTPHAPSRTPEDMVLPQRVPVGDQPCSLRFRRKNVGRAAEGVPELGVRVLVADHWRKDQEPFVGRPRARRERTPLQWPVRGGATARRPGGESSARDVRVSHRTRVEGPRRPIVGQRVIRQAPVLNGWSCKDGQASLDRCSTNGRSIRGRRRDGSPGRGSFRPGASVRDDMSRTPVGASNSVEDIRVHSPPLLPLLHSTCTPA